MNKNNKILPPIIAFILSIIIGQVILWIINRFDFDFKFYICYIHF